jgi:hypothetical protein
MSAFSDAQIEAFGEARIKPSTQSALLHKISEAAFELIFELIKICGRDGFEVVAEAAYDLIQISELERSGIREGDGYWHGSDAMRGYCGELIAYCTQCYPELVESHELIALCRQYDEARRLEGEHKMLVERHREIEKASWERVVESGVPDVEKWKRVIENEREATD